MSKTMLENQKATGRSVLKMRNRCDDCGYFRAWDDLTPWQEYGRTYLSCSLCRAGLCPKKGCGKKLPHLAAPWMKPEAVCRCSEEVSHAS